jgi:hypothetical protein
VNTPWSGLREALKHCLERRLTFAAFRIAGQAVQLLVQRTSKVHHLGTTELDTLRNVFVIAPSHTHSERSWCSSPTNG